MAKLCVALAFCAGSVTARSFRYTSLGDYGCGGYDAGFPEEVLSANAFHSTAQELDGQFTLSVGDNIYVGDTERGIRESFENMWTKKGVHHSGDWLHCKGNHDNAGTQLAYHSKNPKWIWPSNYFTKVMDTGLNFTVQIWGIDTHAFDAGQLGWLEKSLQESTARWKIFFTHYPWISSGRHARVPAPVTTAQIAKKYGVQIVFNGHDHLLQSLVHEGVAFAGTGAVARGAMLNRNVEKDKTDFLWTWGMHHHIGHHGIYHVALTKNVMYAMLFFRENLVHEFQTVWDWPLRYKDLGDDPKDKSFPSPKVIVQYLNEEADETKEEAVREEKGEPTPPPTPQPTRGGVDTKLVDEKAVEAENKKLNIGVPEVPGTVQKAVPTAQFIATAVCWNCLGPSMNRNLTLWVQGVKVSAEDHRLFLAYSPLDCNKEGEESAIPGTGPVALAGPMVTLKPRGGRQVQTTAFVCFSKDAGKTYASLKQAGTGMESFELLVEPEKVDEEEMIKQALLQPDSTPPPQQKKKTKKSRIPTLVELKKLHTGETGVSVGYFYILLFAICVAVPVSWYATTCRPPSPCHSPHTGLRGGMLPGGHLGA